jgi:hypothetical protein
MMNLRITDHARTRLPQRNIKKSDLDLVMEHGTETRDGIILREKDVIEEIKELKAQIKRLERLINVYVVVNKNIMITAYRPRPGKLKKVMRSADFH